MLRLEPQAVVPEEVEAIIRSVSDNVATEIQRSLDFYAATSTEDEISRIYLSGGSARVPGLTRTIQDKTGLPVELINGAAPGPRLYLGAAIHGDEVDGVAILFPVAPIDLESIILSLLPE